MRHGLTLDSITQFCSALNVAQISASIHEKVIGITPCHRGTGCDTRCHGGAFQLNGDIADNVRIPEKMSKTMMGVLPVAMRTIIVSRYSPSEANHHAQRTGQ